MKNLLTTLTTGLVCLAIMATVALEACKKKCHDPTNPGCDDYNPCLSQQPLTAQFTMWEKAYYEHPNFEDVLDDTSDGGPVVFKPSFYGADSYEWKIGAGIYHSDSLELNFSNAPDSISIPITLTIRKKRNTACFPNEDTVLTLTKNLAIIKNKMGELNGGLYYGKWGGYYIDSPGHYSVVTIQRPTGLQNNGSIEYFIYNLSPGIDTSVFDADNYRFITYFQNVYSHTLGYDIYGNYARVDSTKQNIEIVTDWRVIDGTPYGTIYTRTFHGKKL